MKDKLLNKTPPETLTSATGEAYVGAYSGSYSCAPLLKPFKFTPSGVLGALEFKHWHFMAISTDEVMIACAVADIAYVGNAFIHVVDLKNKKTIAHASFLGMPGVNIKVNQCPGEGAIAKFRQFATKIDLRRPNRSSSYYLEVKHKDLIISAKMDTKNAPESLIVIGGQKKHRYAFTQKANLLSVKGKMLLRGREWNLDGGLSSLDYSAGLYPRLIEWYWGFGQGKLEDGSNFGFNLAKGNNLGGQLENAIWLHDKIYRLGTAEFIFDKKHLKNNWKIKTEDDVLDMEFTPAGIHQENKELVLVGSRFAQLLGTYSGTVMDPSTGKKYQFNNLPGISEDQYIKW